MYKLFIKQKILKITDHYEVTDENEKVIYFVDQDFKFIGNTVRVKKYDGSKSFVIDREILTFLPRYKVEFKDGKSFSIEHKFSLLKRRLDIVSNDYKLEIQGAFFDMDFDVYNDGMLVGSISKEWLRWGDSFVIEVIDHAFEEELVALVIAIDEIKDRDSR